jgi:FkbM family methyltransferase
MPLFQSLVQAGVRVVPRGWAHVLKAAGRVFPPFHRYEVVTKRGDTLVVDLRYKMCAPYVLYGEIPHDRGVDTLMRYVVQEGHACVDVGANIGYYTRLLSDLAGERGRVTAIEPIPDAVRLLRQNTAGRANVTLVTAALSDHAGEADFYLASTEDMSSLSATAGTHRLRVQLTTLDALLETAERVDFIKIDVEGFEYQVLRGGLSVLAKHQPIVAFELTQRYIDEYGYDLGDFRELLAPLEYSLHFLDHSGTGHTLLSATRSNDAVAVPGAKRHLFN